MGVKLLTVQTSFGVSKLKKRLTGSSESTLVKVQHCWKSRVVAQILIMAILGIM